MNERKNTETGFFRSNADALQQLGLDVGKSQKALASYAADLENEPMRRSTLSLTPSASIPAARR